MKKLAISLLAMLLLIGILAGCGQTQPATDQQQPGEQTVSDVSFQLGTVVTITLYDWQEESTLDLAFAEIERLENLLSVNRPQSDLAKLYENAGVQPVQVSDETLEVLTAAQQYAALSQGYFDVTAGPLIALWNIDEGQGHYPTDQERQAAMALIDYHKLEISNGNLAYLPEKGMRVDLGAIAKGYVADQVKKVLLEAGVKHAVINLGGNVLTIGSRPDGGNFAIGVQDPLAEIGTVLLAAAVDDSSLVSSGTYERRFEYNGKEYHHILDPFTGYPTDSGLVGVTIASASSMQGDALSTICLLLGQEKALELINSLDGVEGLFVAPDGTVTMTAGMQKLVLEQPK